MKSDRNILQLFSTLDSQQSINRLVEVCFKIALSQVRFNYKKVQKIILRDGISIDDIAIDSIASLFEKDESGSFHNLINPFNSWQPPIKSEEDAFFFLNKLIQKRVEQHISSILRELDPFFSKLMDSVNYLIKRHDPSEPGGTGFKKINYLGTIYIISSDYEEISGKFIPIEEFEKLPALLFCERKNLLHSIFLYLVSETAYVSAIPFNALVYKLKELNVALYKVSESTTEQNDNIEVNSLIEQALSKTFYKLEESYLHKEKLSLEESQKIRKALIDMSNDIKDGGVNPGLYKYLLVHYDELDEHTYKQKYHNILEYLLKVLKQNIAEELEQ
jgi:hypothetical protein